MQPQLAPFSRRAHDVRRAHEKALEHIGQVAHGELVVEVDGRLPERACGFDGTGGRQGQELSAVGPLTHVKWLAGRAPRDKATSREAAAGALAWH